jgi:fructose-1,6-bisphosphatase
MKRVKDIFKKMLMEYKKKVLSMLLEKLKEIIIKKKEDISEWMYVMLKRIIKKLGGEMIG